MQPILALTWLTLKAALRYRLVVVLSVLLLAGVVALPLVIKDDGTARGFTQILLTYTLSLITTLLGFATLWLACGTLAREVEECQLQMVLVKPIARWQVWVGKWLGILCLNGFLLLLSGGAVFVLLQWRAGDLPQAQQKILREEVLVSRGSAREPPPELEGDVDRITRTRLAQDPTLGADAQGLRRIIEEQVRASHQLVPPGFRREWKINLGRSPEQLRDQPIYLRVKFNVAQNKEDATYLTLWEVGDSQSALIYRLEPMKLTADSYHEFPVPPNLFDAQGVLSIRFFNQNELAILFPLEDGMEVLFREGGFGLNFARGLAIIFSWLALLAALGLAAASFLSFPVAAFCSLAALVVAFSTGTLTQIVQEGGISGLNHESGKLEGRSVLDLVAVPGARAFLRVINLAQEFSPIDSLSSGRSISWGELGRAFLQICLLMSGLMAAFGIIVFTRRELASTQGTS